jgi:hypothetical protein
VGGSRCGDGVEGGGAQSDEDEEDRGEGAGNKSECNFNTRRFLEDKKSSEEDGDMGSHLVLRYNLKI